jgi:serine/threonine protein kinase
MSPEQLRGERVDARSDIWGVGTVLYEMATRHFAFHEKTSTATADAILHKPPAPPGRLALELSPGLEFVILKCLEKEAENRYQSAKDVAVDLRRLSTPSSANPITAAYLRPRRRLVKTAIEGIIMLMLVVALLVALNPGG